MKNEAITSRDVDFAKWYTDVVNGTLEIHGDADVEGGTLDL